MRLNALLICVSVGAGAPCVFALAAPTQFAAALNDSSMDFKMINELERQAQGAGAAIVMQPGCNAYLDHSSYKPFGPVRISGGVIARNRISLCRRFTPTSRKELIERHFCAARNDIKTGTVELLEVASTTNRIFNTETIDAVKQWRYKVYLLNFEPTDWIRPSRARGIPLPGRRNETVWG